MTKMRIIVTISAIFAFSALFAQDAKPADAKTDNAAGKTTEAKDAKTEGKAPLSQGYGDVSWGADFATVKSKVKGKVAFAEENKLIITKDGEITYKYGFFYINPETVPDMPNSGKPARLFYAVIEFPYISMNDIKQKITEKYGEPTGENVKKNKGALYWEGTGTSAVMWIDEYEKKPYCRKIVYFSKDIVVELKDYKGKIFNKQELDVLKSFLP